MKYSYWSHVKFKARNFMCTSNAAQWSYHISSFIYFLIILNAGFTSPPLVKNPTSSLYSIHDLVFYFTGKIKSNRKKLSTLHLGTCCQLVPRSCFPFATRVELIRVLFSAQHSTCTQSSFLLTYSSISLQQSPTLSMGYMFQDTQWTPETSDSTECYIFYVLFQTYIQTYLW